MIIIDYKLLFITDPYLELLKRYQREGTVSPTTRLVPLAYMILHVEHACLPAQEVPPRRRKSPRTAPPPTFPYSLTLQPAAALTRSDPQPHSISPDRSISNSSSLDVQPTQRLPSYLLTLRTAAAPTRSESHPAAAPTFFSDDFAKKVMQQLPSQIGQSRRTILTLKNSHSFKY